MAFLSFSANQDREAPGEENQDRGWKQSLKKKKSIPPPPFSLLFFQDPTVHPRWTGDASAVASEDGRLAKFTKKFAGGLGGGAGRPTKA